MCVCVCVCEKMGKDEKGGWSKDMAMLVKSSLPQVQYDSESLLLSLSLLLISSPFSHSAILSGEWKPSLHVSQPFSVLSGCGVQEAESQNGGGGTQ